MKYSVTITKKHCEGRSYLCTGDCPLFAAILEQLPEFPLRSIGGNYVRDADMDMWKFESSFYEDGWNSSMMRKIKSGEVKSHVVTFSFDKKAFKNATKPAKQAIRYVSVPETINEQAKKLILS